MLAPNRTEEQLSKFSLEADRRDLTDYLIKTRLLQAEEKHDPVAVYAAITKYFNKILYRSGPVRDRRLARARNRGARCRQRQKAGRTIFAIELPEVETIEALKRAGFLLANADSHDDVCAALQCAVLLLIEG